MGKNKNQRGNAKRNKKENENHLHATPDKESTNNKKRKHKRDDKSNSGRPQQKSPTHNCMDNLAEHQQDVNGGDDTHTIKNDVRMSKQNGTYAVDFDNSKKSEQGVSTDQEIESDTINSSITHSIDENNQNENEPNDFIKTDSCLTKEGDDLPVAPECPERHDQKQDDGPDIQHNIANTIPRHTIKSDEQFSGTGSKTSTKQNNFKENTEDYKENDDDDECENDSENGKNINGHIQQSREDLDKAIIVADTSGIDNGVQNQQGQSKGDFRDKETDGDTYSLITLGAIENNQNEEETTDNKNNLIFNKNRDQYSEEDDHDRSIGSKLDKNVTETFPTFNTETLNTSGDGGDKIDDEQDNSDDAERQFFQTDSCLNMDDIPLAPEYPESNDQNQENVTDIHNKIANTTSRNTIKCEEQCASTSSKPTIDKNIQGQNNQPSQMNDITVQAESSTTLQGIDQPSTLSQNEMKGVSNHDLVDDKNTPEKVHNGPSEIENIAGEFSGDKQSKCVHANLNNSVADTSSTNSTTALNEFDSTDNVFTDEINKLDTTHKGIRNHEQKFEPTNRLSKENMGNDDDGSSLNEHTFEKENGKNLNGHVQQPKEEFSKAVNEEIILLKTELDSLKQESESIKVQIQQSVEETKETFHQEMKTLQQQLESVAREKFYLSECKGQLEQELKCEKQELDVWKEKANKLESEKEKRDQLEQEYEKVFKELKGWKEKAGMLESQEDVFTVNWKESKEQTQQKLTSFEVELTSTRQEKEQVVEDKNQLEEQLLQVNDELEGWKQNSARLESQLAQSQQSMEETKNYFQQNLAILQQQLESAKEEKFNLSEDKNQLGRELETVTGELDESREKSNELQNQNEEIQQSLEETKHNLHQELSSLQNQLDSVKQENSNIQDEKHHLVQEQQLLTDQLEECKTKLAQLENRKEQLNISTKAIEDTIKQEYSSIQRHLESNGSEGQDYKRLNDDKDRLEEELMHVNSEIDEMKEKVVELENVKGEKDQLEQELDRMREIAGQLESMKEEIERYRVQYQQINDQLRTTEQKLEQSYQECEGLSADLARKGEKEEHYRYIETMVVTLGREKESHLREIQELKNKVDLVEEVLSSYKEEKKIKDETIKQLKADVQIKEENSNQIKRQYEAALEKFQTMGQSRDSEIENQKREIARITSQKQQLEENIFKIRTELEKKHSELQREQLEHIQSKNILTQYVEAIKKMNSQVQSKDKEIEIMQEEVNKVRIESREFQLKYRDLPQKEANFKVIENSNRYLIDENAQLQERIRSFGPFESTLHYLREENSRLSWEGQRYQERISFMEQKYRDQTCNIQQMTEEVQVFRGHRIELKRQLHQKTDEAEAVSRRLKDTLEKKENLEKELLDTQEKKENLERELQGENPESQNFGDSHGPEGHNVQAIPGQRSGRGRLIRRT